MEPSKKSSMQTDKTSPLETHSEIAGLWQLYLVELLQLNQLWLNTLAGSVVASAKLTGQSSGQSSTNSSWMEPSFFWNWMSEATSSLTQLPLLGIGRGFNQKLIQTVEAWVKLYPTSFDYQKLLAEIQMRALEQMTQELFRRVEKGEPPSWPQVQQLWSATADQLFEQAFRSEDNLRVRGQLLNAVNHHKLCQQELFELWLKTLNMPIRSEVDEVHQSIYELRKEVKRLKKNLARYEATPPNPKAEAN